MAIEIEIGSGEYPRFIDCGFLHSDIRWPLPHQEICMDIEALPFKPDSLGAVAVIHCLEHISWRKIAITLKGIYDAIKSGGYIQICCPNLLFIANRILEIDNDVQDIEELMPSEHGTPIVLQDIYCAQNFDVNYHKSGFIPKTLRLILESVGFVKIELLTKRDECGIGMKGYKV